MLDLVVGRESSAAPHSLPSRASISFVSTAASGSSLGSCLRRPLLRWQFLGWKRALRLPTVIASAALPLVWAFQYSGGAGPQWGGRYELVSGALLVVAGVVALAGRRRALTAVLGLSLFVTAFGVTWLSVRSHGVAAAFETILARDDEAVISAETHLFREGGAFYRPGAHWLTRQPTVSSGKPSESCGTPGTRSLRMCWPRARRPLVLSKDLIVEEPGVCPFSEGTAR